MKRFIVASIILLNLQISAQTILVENDAFPEPRSISRIHRSINSSGKIPVRVIEVSESEDLSTGVYIEDSWYSSFSYSQRYVGQCPPDTLYYDSYSGSNYTYFSECMAEYAVEEINSQLALLPGAPEEVFEFESFHRIYDADNFDSPDGHTMLSEYFSDTTINTPGYMNIVVTNAMFIPNSSNVLAGTTYLYQDANDDNGAILLVESESTPYVLVHELGHVVGFPHLLQDSYLEMFNGDSILIEAIPEPNCEFNYMSSWMSDDCEFSNPNSIEVGDMNGNGIVDMVSASSDGFGMGGMIGWHENDGSGNIINHLIDQDLYGFDLSLDDMDGDGDLDILLASKDLFGSSGYFSYYENQGAGSFAKDTLGTHPGANSIEGADMDSDGNMDILCGSSADSTISIYLNDGSLNFTENVVSSSAGDVFDVNAVDMDGDGDMDIVAAAKSSQELSWFENAGDLTFTKHTIISDWSIVNGPMTALPVDFDGDGDMDVISFGAYDTRVYLGLNDGSQSFSDVYVGLGYSVNLTNPKNLKVLDLDGDLDLDFLCAYENGIATWMSEGNNTFTGTKLWDTDNGTHVTTIDMYGDGDLDILVTETNNYRDDHDYLISWLESEGNQIVDQHGISDVIRPTLNTDQHGDTFGEILQSWVNFHNPPLVATNLVINEFLASNDSCCTDPSGDNDDYIEIFNYGTEAVDIGGYLITDDIGSYDDYYQIPSGNDSTIIQPGGFLLLWADKDSEEGVLHVEIKLSEDGEEIGLFMPDSFTVVDTLVFGSQTSDISFGRYPDGSETWQSMNPTPGTANTQELSTSNELAIATQFLLYRPYPNPFNPTTTIRYSIDTKRTVSLRIYDIAGRLVEKLSNRIMEPGEYNIQWNASNYASGIYFLELVSSDQRHVEKLILMK